MELAVQIVQIVFYCIAILLMIILSIISIWGFVIFNKIYKNQKANNLLLDKINNSISKLCPSATQSNLKLDDSNSLNSNYEVDIPNSLNDNDKLDLNDLIDTNCTYDKENDNEYSKDNIISF